MRRGAGVGRLARHQREQRRAEGVHVAPGVYGGPQRLLRGDEVRGSEHRGIAGAGEIVARVVQRPREAQIEHLDGARFGEHQVRGLHVAVYEALRVRLSETGRRLRHVPRRLRVVQRPVVPHEGLQVGPVHVLHHEEVRPGRVAHVVHAHDVRVVERRDRAGLAQEPLDPGGVARARAGQYLDRDAAVELGVLAEVHHPRAALSDGAQDAVRTQNHALVLTREQALRLKRREQPGPHERVGAGARFCRQVRALDEPGERARIEELTLAHQFDVLGCGRGRRHRNGPRRRATCIR